MTYSNAVCFVGCVEVVEDTFGPEITVPAPDLLVDGHLSRFLVPVNNTESELVRCSV